MDYLEVFGNGSLELIRQSADASSRCQDVTCLSLTVGARLLQDVFLAVTSCVCFQTGLAGSQLKIVCLMIAQPNLHDAGCLGGLLHYYCADK